MGTRYNNYYIDPAIGRAASNIAQLFAPPSRGEVAGIVQAEAARGQNQRQQTAFDAITNPAAGQDVVDRFGVAAGLFDPTRSYYAQNQNDATERRGDDLSLQGTLGSARIGAGATIQSAQIQAAQRAAAVQAELAQKAQQFGDTFQFGAGGAFLPGQTTPVYTQPFTVAAGAAPFVNGEMGPANTATAEIEAASALERSILDNQRAVITSAMSPLGEDQVRPEMSADVLGLLGFPGALPQAAGPRSPMSEDEVIGSLIAGATEDGDITGVDVRNRFVADGGALELEQVLGEDGSPVFVTQQDAVGRQPFVNPGSRPAMDQVVYVNRETGEQLPGVFDPASGEARLANGSPVPPGFVPVELGKPTGTNEDLGLTTGVKSTEQRRVLAARETIQTIQTLRDLIQQNPGSQGVVGALRGTAQNIMQTGGELGALFGDTSREVSQAIAQGMIGPEAAGMFDPSIPAIDMLYNVLAWQYAKAQSGDRVSNEQLRVAREALGSTGMLANQANSIARLNQLEQQLMRQMVNSDTALRQGTPPPPAGGPQPGEVMDGYQFLGGNPADPNSWRRVQ